LESVALGFGNRCLSLLESVALTVGKRCLRLLESVALAVGKRCLRLVESVALSLLESVAPGALAEFGRSDDMLQDLRKI
jgi:hypothetical protein